MCHQLWVVFFSILSAENCIQHKNIVIDFMSVNFVCVCCVYCVYNVYVCFRKDMLFLFFYGRNWVKLSLITWSPCLMKGCFVVKLASLDFEWIFGVVIQFVLHIYRYRWCMKHNNKTQKHIIKYIISSIYRLKRYNSKLYELYYCKMF